MRLRFGWSIAETDANRMPMMPRVKNTSRYGMASANSRPKTVNTIRSST